MPIFGSNQQPDIKELRLGADAKVRLDGGVSYKYVESQLNDNQSPSMLNENADDQGTLTKRNGQEWVYATSLGAGGLNGAFERLFQGKKVFAWGTKLYTQTGTNAPVEVMTGLANARARFFAFNSLLYMINGTDFIQWDGATASQLTPYIPTLQISMTPAGGGTAFEDFNLLSPYFINSFSGDGTTKIYNLTVTGLDAAAIVASTDGGVTYNKVETTDFTVNRSTGVVTWITAPPTGTNNVKIKAAKTVSGNVERIKNCRYAIDYGGANDTRMFFSGNPNYPNRVHISGLKDPAYWPENSFNDVGSDFEPVYGFAKHYDKLVIFKERSIFYTEYLNVATQGFWGAGGFEVTFPLYPINSAVGCDMPDSIQIIENNIVFGNSSNGLFILLSTEIKNERDIRPISGNINGTILRPGLLSLSKSDLQNASSVDFEGKYWLCIGNQAYVWDYRLTPFYDTGNADKDEERLAWFPYSNINAKCWIMDGQSLFYCDRDNGKIATFYENYNDFGNSIMGRWKSKLFNFNIPDFLKTIPMVWLTTRAGSYSAITITYFTENSEIIASETVDTVSFSWAHFAWNTFSWAVYKFAPTIRLKPKMKKVVYFQIEFSNNQVNQNLSILSLVIQYLRVRKVK